MNSELLRITGNIDQLAGIREGVLLRGRGEGMKTAEFHNAAGLRFTVLPDRCMDIYDLSFRGMNLSFHAKNGPVSPVSSGKITEDFEDTWPGGMLVTCGLENINGGYADHGVNHMTHGRISSVQAERFLTRTCWSGDDFLLEAEGEMNESRMGTGTLRLRRKIVTSLYARSVTITDTVTNLTEKEMPYALLYHVNFGFPLLDPGATTGARGVPEPLDDVSMDWENINGPGSGNDVQKFLRQYREGEGLAFVQNRERGLSAYLSYDSSALPYLVEWKHLKPQDYVLAYEPTNLPAINKKEALSRGICPTLPAYGSVSTHLEIGVIEGTGIPHI